MTEMNEPRPTRILVIDDEVTQRMLVKEYLEEAGYQVRLSEDGEHGLKIATAISPDLIIVDALLPSMDGYTVCSTLRQRSKTSEIPIILMTASKEADAIAKGFAAGATDFITKPVEWRFLADRVAYVLEKSRHMQELHTEKSSIEEELRLTSERREQETGLSQAEVEKIRSSLMEEARLARQEAEDRARDAEEAAEARLRTSRAAFEQQIESLRNQVESLEHELGAARTHGAEELRRARSEAENAIRKAQSTSDARLEASVSAYESRVRGLEFQMTSLTAELEAAHAERDEQIRAVRAEASEAIRTAQSQAETYRSTSAADVDMGANEPFARRGGTDNHASGFDERNKSIWGFVRSAHEEELDAIKAIQVELEELAADVDRSPPDMLRDGLGRAHAKAKSLAGSTQKTNVFLQSLLDQSRLSETEFDAADHIKRIVARIEKACSQRGLEVQSDCPVTGLRVFADRAKIDFVLNNLVANSIRFTPSGGVLALAIGRDEDGTVRISVADNGVGMNPALVERINTCIERPDLIGQSAGTPLGLGLPICHSIARLHGGRLEIDSVVGQGTTVSIILPSDRVCDPGVGAERSTSGQLRYA